jgi:RNA polymerase sigma-70 factor (ECF subfamily)
VALTLRALGGLTTPRSRARSWSPRPRWRSGSCARSARSATPGIRYELPRRRDLPARLGSVLATLYLVFNEGYAATAATRCPARAVRRGDPARARAVALMPDEPEALGLLALMRLHDSRRARASTPAAARPARRPGPLALGPAAIAEGCG